MAGNGRSKAGSGLSSLACPSLIETAPLLRHPARWPPNAFLVLLKFSSDVKAGALLESIDGVYCSEPTTSSPRTRIAVWPDALGEFIVGNDQQCRRASGVPARGEISGADEPASAHGGWITGSWNLW